MKEITSSFTITRKDEVLRNWPNEQCTKLTCEGLKKKKTKPPESHTSSFEQIERSLYFG